MNPVIYAAAHMSGVKGCTVLLDAIMTQSLAQRLLARQFER